MAELNEQLELEYAKLGVEKERICNQKIANDKANDLEYDRMKDDAKREKRELFHKLILIAASLTANLILAFVLLTFEHWCPTKIMGWVRPLCM